MKKLRELTEDYTIIKNKLDEIFEQIYRIMNLEVLIRGERFKPISFDIDNELITLSQVNLMGSNKEQVEVSFEDFETLLELYNLKTQS